MAKREHLETLLSGIPAWNTWRADNPDLKPDLSGASLRHTMLRNANLRSTNLSNADLRDSHFRGATLEAARLRNTKLHRAYLSAVTLQGADLEGAILYETVFGNAVLAGARGLESCDHRGPSILDHRTIQKSVPLPLEFLRGCGFSDENIREVNKLGDNRANKSGYNSCFISYSSKDRNFAEKLHADLQARGVRCWFAPKNIRIGEKLRDAIDQGIRDRERLLLILSESSVISAWVEKEVETAFEEEVLRSSSVLFPIRLDNSIMTTKAGWAADIRRGRHIGDFSDWKKPRKYNGAFRRLLRDLEKG